MNGIENDKATRKPLSLRQATAIVIAISCFILLLTAVGMHEFLFGKKYYAILCCIVASVWLGTLPIYVFLYLQVKKGVAIVLNPVALLRISRDKFSATVLFAGLLTFLSLLLVLTGLGSVYLCYTAVKLMTVKVIIGGINLFLWLIVAFAWYRLIVTESRKTRQAEAVLEQPEDVWPPAPRNPDNGL